MGLTDLLSGGLGIVGNLFNSNQANKNEDFYRSEGDPERSLLRQYTLDPNSYFKGPVAQELARQADTRYSSQFGNPAGSGTAQALSLEAMLNGYGAERDRLAKEGGLSDINAGIVPGNNAKSKAYQGVFGSLQDMLGMLGGGSAAGGGGAGGGASMDDLLGAAGLA